MCTNSDNLWTAGLSLKSRCYEGIVKDVESLLEKFRQQTVTTWGTRTSTTTASKAVVRSIDSGLSYNDMFYSGLQDLLV